MMTYNTSSYSMDMLTVNRNLFNDIISEIKHNVDTIIPQPIMVIGEYGSGKTTLMKRLYDACTDKMRIWIDGRTIFSTTDILQSGNITHGTALFIDDIDYYLTRCSYDEQYRFRNILYNEGAPMLISTASKILPAITEYKAPFFEGLKLMYINPVSTEELYSVLDNNSLSRIISLLELLPPTIKSVKTSYNIIKLNKDQAYDKLMLLSIFSDKYRTLYDGLPTNSQRILNTLGSEIDWLTLSEIRVKSGLSTGILSAYIKLLKKADLIIIDKSMKRNTKYSVKDPLFKIWLGSNCDKLPI